MLNVNMEFIQAFNPLYAVPIVAVILCAFIVYAFGFKSPVPPPSFEAIEEDKKYSKKKRSKDTQKKEKSLQNGKVSDAPHKSAPPLPKKKESNEKPVVAAKPNNATKASVSDKKGNKKVKLQTDRKLAHEKKKDSVSQDDFNDDGWVQLVSKKGRKNKKKDDVVVAESQTVDSVMDKSAEKNTPDNSSQIEELVKKTSELPDTVAQIDKQQQPKKETVPKAADLNVNAEKSKIKNVVIEVSKPCDEVEKQPPKEDLPKVIKVLEESNKSKKKKKKNTEMPKELVSNMKSNASESSTFPSLSEVSKPEVSKPEISKPEISKPEVSKPEVAKPVTEKPIVKSIEDIKVPEAKTSNVAFDELAGLYPETKEPKKKKKVRRDH